MLTHDLPDVEETSVRRMRRRLRRTLMRRLRREQSGRYWARLVLAPVRRAISDMLKSETLLSDLHEAGLDGVASAFVELARELDAAETAIGREEN